MMSKSDRTKAHILEQVAPIFNRKGYVGTSLASIVSAIGLSKGAIYSNFDSKEDLALAAFDYNVRRVIWPLADQINMQTKASAKLMAITQYYRQYYEMVKSMGGCPILNIGIDANNQNPDLSRRVQMIMNKLIDQLAEIIELGIKSGEFKNSSSPKIVAKRIYSMIEGSLFSTSLMNNGTYLQEMMDYIDIMIEQELQK